MEQLLVQPRTKLAKRFVEDFRSFSISQLGRGPLRRKRQTDGGFWFDNTAERPDGRYRISHGNDGSVVVELSYFSVRAHAPVHHDIQLEAVAATYGQRAYLRCPSCESRRNKLQISSREEIGCRNCLDLVNQSTRERHTNPLLRSFRRHMKLREKAANVHCVVYDGHYTRRAASILRMAKRIGTECHRI